jgi:hypothetical protein
MTWHEVEDKLDATVAASRLGLADPLILSDASMSGDAFPTPK